MTPNERKGGTPCSGTRRGFTLLELLVVISVIAVLVAILLPVLEKARTAANRVTCLSNQRQIGIGMHAYAQDRSGLLPGPTTTHSTPRNIQAGYAGWSPVSYDGHPTRGVGNTGVLMARDYITWETAYDPAAASWQPARPATLSWMDKEALTRSRWADWVSASNAFVPVRTSYSQRNLEPRLDEWQRKRANRPILSGFVGQFRWHDGMNNALFLDGHAEGFPVPHLKDHILNTGKPHTWVFQHWEALYKDVEAK